MKYDLFISHASEDKDAFVRELAIALRAEGLSVWYDEFALRAGDSLAEAIDRGLAESRHGLVVLSPSFFEKRWPRRELDGLVQRQTTQSQRFLIIPVLHEMTPADVARHSPILADVFAVLATAGLERVVDQILSALHVVKAPDAEASRGTRSAPGRPAAQLALGRCRQLAAMHTGVKSEICELSVSTLAADGSLTWVYSSRPELPPPPRAGGLGSAALSGPVVVPDIRAVNPRWTGATGAPLLRGPLLAAPLVATDDSRRVIGVAMFSWTEKVQINEDHRAFLEELCGLIASLIEIRR
jgi:GAF domain-containing protein